MRLFADWQNDMVWQTMNGHDKYTRRLELTNGDPWRFSSLKVSKQRYSARRRGLNWALDADSTVKKIAESTHCAISGRPLEFEIDNVNSPSIDRKNSGIGYTDCNIQIVTTGINKAKQDLSDDEFIKLCCDVAANNGWIKRDIGVES